MGKELDYRDSIDDWANKYEKAENDGVFRDADKAAAIARQKTPSFFGLQSQEPDSGIDAEDAQHWSDVSKLSDLSIANTITEDSKNKFQNPVTVSSVGMDQDGSQKSLGGTYSDEDLEELSQLKIKLHDLEDKLAVLTFESMQKNKSAITSLKEKINELSDALSENKD